MDTDTIRRETELVRADWAGRGRHWDRRADEIAEQAARMNAPLIEAADIAPGQQVCEIATGAGEPALSVAVLVGDGRPRLRHRPLPRDGAGRPPPGRRPGAPQYHLPHRRHAGAPRRGLRVRPGDLPLRADVLPGACACRRRGAARAQARRAGGPSRLGAARGDDHVRRLRRCHRGRARPSRRGGGDRSRPAVFPGRPRRTCQRADRRRAHATWRSARSASRPGSRRRPPSGRPSST